MISGTRRFRISRPGLPTTSPMKSSLIARASDGVVDRAELADDLDTDLSRIVDFLLDARRDVARQVGDAFVADLLVLDHHAQLLARSHGIRAPDSREAVRDLLHPGEP